MTDGPAGIFKMTDGPAGIFKKKWFRITILVAGAVIIVYAMIYVDVVLRARSAFLEGEKYWRWHNYPQEKQKFLDERLDKEIKELQEKFSKNKITKEEQNKQEEIARFNHKRELEESSIKYAYVWYQTAVELFSPPESKWVRASREKLPQAREIWRQELIKMGIKVEDYMLD